jgi:DnaB-like helicase N terminal domain
MGVVSSIMFAPSEAIAECVEAGLDTSWFYVPALRTIYGELRDMCDSGEAIDLITFTQRLRDKKLIDSVGGAAAVTEVQLYLDKISNFAPTIAHLPYHLGIVRDLYLRRQVIFTGTEMVRRAYNPDPNADISDVLDEISSRAASLRSLQGRNGARFSFRSPSEILAMPRNRSANFLGDRLLGIAQSLVMAGIGGIGKSRLVLQLLVAFIIERVWCGIETHHTRDKLWMLVQTQNSISRLQDDLEPLKKFAGRDWSLVEKNLFVHTLETDRDLILHLSEPQNARDLENEIRQRNPIGVAFDPLNDLAIGDLSKDVDMKATCREIGRHLACWKSRARNCDYYSRADWRCRNEKGVRL